MGRDGWPGRPPSPIPTLSFPFFSSPFKGEAGRGMG